MRSPHPPTADNSGRSPALNLRYQEMGKVRSMDKRQHQHCFLSAHCVDLSWGKERRRLGRANTSDASDLHACPRFDLVPESLTDAATPWHRPGPAASKVQLRVLRQRSKFYSLPRPASRPQGLGCVDMPAAAFCMNLNLFDNIPTVTGFELGQVGHGSLVFNRF
jgi:hypothetical protein